MKRVVSRIRTREGFTLVELAVVIVIIGVLAAFGVPKFLQSVEKSKAAEAFNYLSAIQSAQERYMAQNGIYATLVTDLNLRLPSPTYFTAAATIDTSKSTESKPAWSLTLKRIKASSSFGDYTVTWTQDGFDLNNSTISSYPAISPITLPAS